MDLSEKEFKWFLKEADKCGVKLETEEQYRQLQRDLYAMAELTLDMYKEHKQFQARLGREPEGFKFPAEGRICKLCMGGGAGDFWYDKRGMRCMDCQVAYIKKIIPGYVFSDSNNARHITETGLITRFNANRKEIRKLIKTGILKTRRVEHGKFPPTIVFLKSENPSLKAFS